MKNNIKTKEVFEKVKEALLKADIRNQSNMMSIVDIVFARQVSIYGVESLLAQSILGITNQSFRNELAENVKSSDEELISMTLKKIDELEITDRNLMELSEIITVLSGIGEYKRDYLELDGQTMTINLTIKGTEIISNITGAKIPKKLLKMELERILSKLR